MHWAQEQYENIRCDRPWCCFQHFANAVSHKHFCMKFFVHTISLGSCLWGILQGQMLLLFFFLSQQTVPIVLQKSSTSVCSYLKTAMYEDIHFCMLVPKCISKCLNFFPVWWVFLLITSEAEYLLIGHLYIFSGNCLFISFLLILLWDCPLMNWETSLSIQNFLFPTYSGARGFRSCVTWQVHCQWHQGA